MNAHLPSPFTIFSPSLLTIVEKDFWNYNSTGFSYAELSHRSNHYVSANSQSQSLVKQYLRVPQNYQVLCLPTDCSYASIPFNLSSLTSQKAIYMVRESESQYAFQQSMKINPKTVRVSTQQQRQQFGAQYGKEKSPFYTVYSLLSFEKGIKYEQLQPQKGQILVCSINNCSHYQQIDIQKHGIVTFQTGKGIGLSGMSVVIVRKDLIGHQLPICPDMMDYSKTVKASSVINTPFTLVPLLIWKQLQNWISLGLSSDTMKQQISGIKDQFQEQLRIRTQITKTQMEGIVRFKMPSNLSRQTAQEYGTIDGDYLTLMLQLPNQGAGRAFAYAIFDF